MLVTTSPITKVCARTQHAPSFAVSMTANDGACWVRAHTFLIDDGVTSIGNVFDRGSAQESYLAKPGAI